MVELKVVRQKEGVELMQNEICKLCGKPMFSKFQMGGGSEWVGIAHEYTTYQ